VLFKLFPDFLFATLAFLIRRKATIEGSHTLKVNSNGSAPRLAVGNGEVHGIY
jgi:hypothetical protein